MYYIHLNIILKLCVYVSISACIQVPVEASREYDPLQLEAQQVVSHLVWGLGTEFGSFARVVMALNQRAISPAPKS